MSRWVKALRGGWFLEDRRKQKRGLVVAGGMTGNSMVDWWLESVEDWVGGIAAEREVGRKYSHLDHVRGSGFEDGAVGSRRKWDLDD